MSRLLHTKIVLPLRHIHHKKRLAAPRKYRSTLLDHLMYGIAFAGPIMTVPQIYDVWIRHQLSVNTITWGSYLVFGLLWLYYGVVHKEKLIIFSNILGIITTGLVVLGAMLFK